MKISKILALLREEVGKKQAIIRYSSPYKVLIATVLSQRTRDSQTLKASEALFAKHPFPKSLANAPEAEIRRLVHGTGFYRQKAKKIRKIAQILVQQYNGKVPDSLEELLLLPGVGRKTANCVLVYAFRKPAIPVDVHVHRISNRLGLVKTAKPEDTEAALSRIVPKRNWMEINELLVKFGQQKCFPRNPNCPKCLLQVHCRYYKEVFLENLEKA